MAKFELSLTENYVSDWNYVDGVREIFQNALDQETESEGNKMFFEYDEEREVLSIGNKTSVLSVSSLLLGATSKSDNEELIGQFGEGYKVATLVLTREGHNVVFYNYGAREVWRPRFVKSRRYGGKNILTFFVDKKYVWQSVPNNDLIIEINNITKEQYEKIVESNLHLQDVGEVFETHYGDILLEERYKGKVYVNGLYICEYDKYHYGYNFKPSVISIDRDRKLVNDFDLRWLASKMWMEGKEEMYPRAMELIKKDASDIEYAGNVYVGAGGYDDLSNLSGKEFLKDYGNNAVPVSNQDELESVKEGYRPIMVTSLYKDMVTKSGVIGSNVYVVEKKPKERLEEWILKYENELSAEALEEFDSILEAM